MSLAISSHSKAMVLYEPRQERKERPFLSLADRVFKKALKLERYAAIHLPLKGEGRVCILLGLSTSGKISIMRSLMDQMPRCLGLSREEFVADMQTILIEEYDLKLYEDMVLGMEHREIAYAVLDKGQRLPRLKEGIDKKSEEAALRALGEAKKHVDVIPRVDLGVAKRVMIEYLIGEAESRPIVACSGVDPEQIFKLLMERSFLISVRVGLVYCPLDVLAERVLDRNIRAFGEGGYPEDWRSPMGAVFDFIRLYKPAEKGDTVIDTLKRDQVETVFKVAYIGEFSHWQRFAGEDVEAGQKYLGLKRDHDSLRKYIFDQLGFGYDPVKGFMDDHVKSVPITPRSKAFHYLLNTHVMKPKDAAEVIGDWK